MNDAYRRRRITLMFIVIAVISVASYMTISTQPAPKAPIAVGQKQSSGVTAESVLDNLPVKGRAPKTGYTRAQFGDGWATVNGCDTREIILHRDMTNVILDGNCNVLKGTLNDPYTGKMIQFVRGPKTSGLVQIDHVVAISNAWQTGAQQLSMADREKLANDPLELLAVDGNANQQKSDGDAATWLPSNKPFRCQYVARQVAIKQKYSLWVTAAEKQAIVTILQDCPNQQVPTAN